MYIHTYIHLNLYWFANSSSSGSLPNDPLNPYVAQPAYFASERALQLVNVNALEQGNSFLYFLVRADKAVVYL